MLTTLLSVGFTLAGFSLLILVHELGHFLAAKLVKVRVEAFALGLGPRLFGRRWGETDYRVCAVPFGGYVKLTGEDTEPEEEPDPYNLQSKTAGQKALIFVAGVVFNLLLAVVAYTFAFTWGVPRIPCVVGKTIPDTAAWEAGVKEGDRIVRINDKTNPTFEHLLRTSALEKSGPVYLRIERDDQNLEYRLTPEYDPDLGFRRLGISAVSSGEITDLEDLDELDERCPAREAGLRVGDCILAVEQVGVDGGEPAPDATASGKQGPVRLTVLRRGKRVDLHGAIGRRVDGLKRWDYVVELNGQAVPSGSDVAWSIRAAVDKPLALTVLRDKALLTLRITVPRILPRILGVSGMGNTIERIAFEGPAYNTGLRVGDAIAAADDVQIPSIAALNDYLKENLGDEVVLHVRRDESTLDVPCQLEDKRALSDFLDSFYIEPKTVITYVLPGSAAEDIGIQAGDEILRLAGHKIEEFSDISRICRRHFGESMAIEWSRGGRVFEKEILPREDADDEYGAIGITLRQPRMIMFRTKWYRAAPEGVAQTWDALSQTGGTVRGFASGDISTRNLGGIVAIVQAMYLSYRTGGLGRLAYLLALLSTGLFILNLLPIPPLDGGLLMLLGVEKVKGSPLNERFKLALYYVGWALVLCLILYAFRNDITRIIELRGM